MTRNTNLSMIEDSDASRESDRQSHSSTGNDATHSTRRYFLRRLGKVALTSLFTGAALFGWTGIASAHYGPYPCGCCGLAKPPSPSTCPSDCNLFPQYSLRSWTCGSLWWKKVCVECTNGTTCKNGTFFLCSYCYSI